MSTEILKKKKILIVDDNAMNRIVAGAVLEPYEVELDEANSGMEAIKLVQHKSYDIILMDMKMSPIDGVETCALLRKDIGVTAPVIALTANVNNNDRMRCLEAGMDDFLSKPYDQNSLIKVLCKWLGETGLAELPSNSAPEQTHQNFSLSTLKKLSGGNLLFEKKMLQIFAEEIETAICRLERALDPLNVEEIGLICHTMKMSMNNMHIHSVLNDIRQLENSPGLYKDVPGLKEIVLKVTASLREVLLELKENDLV